MNTHDHLQGTSLEKETARSERVAFYEAKEAQSGTPNIPKGDSLCRPAMLAVNAFFPDLRRHASLGRLGLPRFSPKLSPDACISPTPTCSDTHEGDISASSRTLGD